jgi:hypothetical protein
MEFTDYPALVLLNSPVVPASRRALDRDLPLQPRLQLLWNMRLHSRYILCQPKRPPKTAFAGRLFVLRKARGMTQVQLAEALGTCQRVISHYETAAELPPSTRRTDASGRRFQRMESLPERDQRAVLRLINSLVTSNSSGRFSSAHQ